jgi:hypothetical protein
MVSAPDGLLALLRGDAHLRHVLVGVEGRVEDLGDRHLAQAQAVSASR